MNNNKTLKFLPRILAISYIIFISLFAFDVFEEGYTILEIIIALFIHLIPSIILIVITTIAFKKELIGGMLLILTGIISAFLPKINDNLASVQLITLPLFVIGILFTINYFIQTRNGK